jgi:hypothetical protein
MICITQKKRFKLTNIYVIKVSSNFTILLSDGNNV